MRTSEIIEIILTHVDVWDNRRYDNLESLTRLEGDRQNPFSRQNLKIPCHIPESGVYSQPM
jgi:hypothetical protein